jgi:hypothetical protein
MADPDVQDIAPKNGPTAGNTAVTISGIGFTGATDVKFGAIPAAGLNIVSDTEIAATSPGQAASVVDVTVTAGGVTSQMTPRDQFTYMDPPAVTGVVPPNGPSAGGTSVTISGSNFTGATDVKFGPVAAAGFNVVSDTQIAATTAPFTLSLVDTAVDVTVTVGGVVSAMTTNDQFTYVGAPLPSIASVSPSNGPIAGGSNVTITGTGFTGATAVNFGSVPAASVNVVSDSQIAAVSPPQALGPTDVRVTTANGISAKVGGDLFTYAPTVANIDPAAGSIGSNVTITGTTFTGATGVNFGSVAATSFTAVSDTQIVTTSPPQGPGSVDVTVTAGGVTSGTSSSDLFTYKTCCVQNFNVPTGRTGFQVVGVKRGEQFLMNVDFGVTGAGCTASCCEYRQFVRGRVIVNGDVVPHPLPNPAGGAPLVLRPRPAAPGDPDNFLEDGAVRAGLPDFRYGHRSDLGGNTDQYLPAPRATASTYRGVDFPGIKNLNPGDSFSVDFDFKGQIIDTCNGGAVISENTWTVTFNGTV